MKKHYLMCMVKIPKKKLTSFALVGKGPDEWKFLRYNNQFTKSDKGILIWLSDSQKGIMVQVNLSKMIKTKSPNLIIKKSFKFDVKAFPCNTLLYDNDKKLIGDGGYFDDNRSRIKSYNTEKQTVKRSALFPTLKNAHVFRNDILYLVYHSYFKKHPTKNLYVQAMSLFNRIDIFDSSLNLVRTMVSGENWKDDFFDAKKYDINTNPISAQRDGYKSIAVSNDFIFAAHSKEEKNPSTGEVEKGFIKVITWDGKPKCLLEVSDDIFNISFDEKEAVLYVADYNKQRITRYNIKDLVQKWKQ